MNMAMTKTWRIKMKTFKENIEDQEITWNDIIEAKTADELNEVSLGRVYQHIQKEKVKSWCILTSYRDGNSPSKNKADFKKLQSKIRSADLGFFKLVGHGQEEDEDGEVQSVKEPSLFVPGIDYKFAVKLMKEYNQFAIVYSGPETGDKIVLVEQNGKQTDLGKFKPQKIAQFYSKLKGKSFVFELKADNLNAARALVLSGRNIPGIDN
jgi:hypothetical protein